MPGTTPVRSVEVGHLRRGEKLAGVIFRQLTHDDLGCASYLIGDEDAGVAAVVDPRLDIDEYLRLARYLGVRIEHVLETHNHADHVSGHGRLVSATGARIHIHRDAAPDYDHEPFDDGWELELGALRVRALHTPGHRPEHTAFALIDTERGEEPWAVLSGDSLFVGDIARPDLAVDKEEGARGIFRSLHGKLLALPDTTELWPGHLGGSLCGGPGDEPQGRLDDRLRARPPGGAGDRRRGRVRARDDRRARAAAAELPQHRRAQPRPAGDGDARGAPAHPAPGRAGATRWWSTSAPSCSSTRRTSPARSRSRRGARASAPSSPGWPTRSSRSCSSAATTRTRSRRPASPPPSGCATSPATSPAA